MIQIRTARSSPAMPPEVPTEALEAGWRRARPGDTPGQLVPGEADTPQPVDAPSHLRQEAS